MVNFVILFTSTIMLGYLVDNLIKLWYTFPIKEEKQTPFYITKELFKEKVNDEK